MKTSPSKPADYQDVNRRAWARLAQHQSFSSQPYGPREFGAAREWLDFGDWIPWDKVASVLCLASGGGQQGPLFASLGCAVTVVDLANAQLNLDREVAQRYDLTIETIQADMLDLSCLYGRKFDLVYQPISAHYVPDVCRLYQEVYRVLRPGGYYWVEHWSSHQMQLDPSCGWDGQAYRILYPQRTDEPVPWSIGSTTALSPIATCWHYIHPLNDLVGGICEAGFLIRRFAERELGDLRAPPGTQEHLAAYLPPFITIFAQRLPKRTRRQAN